LDQFSIERRLAKKFYVVWRGRKTGVFTDWATARLQVDNFTGAQHKSFMTRIEAEHAFKSGMPAPVGGAAATKSAANGIPAPITSNFDLQIYCDGACEPNPGNAGSGIAVYRSGRLAQLWYGLHNPHGTNNTAELNALQHAFLMAEEAIGVGQSVQVLCDSMYSINCVSKWAVGWEKSGWRKASGEIKNLEVIKAAYVLYGRIKSHLQLTHVTAHAGTEGNELADRMAMFAVQSRTKDWCRYHDIDVRTVLRMRAG
jgi:ribonuclease HI